MNPETVIKIKGLFRLSRIGAFINHPTGQGIPREEVKKLIARCAPYLPFDVWPVFNRLTNIKFGYVGSSDTIGIVPIRITSEMVGKTVGVATCVEFKTKTGRQSKDQKKFQSHVERYRGVYTIQDDHNDIDKRVMAEVISQIKGGA